MEEISINDDDVEVKKDKSPLLQPLLVQNDEKRSSTVYKVGEIEQKTVEIPTTPWKKFKYRVKKIIHFFQPEKLGLYRGVMLPAILHIFGYVIFLRVGLVVGQCGLWLAILEFSISYLVAFLTTLSVSAICTNGRIKGGGAYYMLSRSIGPEIGGSCGIVFYFGAVAGGCTYILGFGEALPDALPGIFPNGRWWRLLYASAALFSIFVVIFIGAEAFGHATLLIFGVTLISLLFAFMGIFFNTPDKISGFTSWKWSTFLHNFYPSFGLDPHNNHNLNFASVFGIVGCHGVMAGVNVSGDLKNPKKDIAKGTLVAVIVTFFLYIFILFILAATFRKESLLTNYSIMADISFIPIIVYIGEFAVLLSSTLTNLIGASRVLQAVARDELIPFIKVFGWGCGKNDEPRLAVALTWAAMQVVVFIVEAMGGDLNVTAPYGAQFHIIAYGFTNFACFILDVSGTPNFRPMFKYWTWWTALAGTFSCIVTMCICEWQSSIVASALLVILMVIIHYYAKPKTWGHVTQALIYHQVRKYLLKLDERKDNSKLWRFQPLLLVANPRTCVPTMMFMNNLKKGGTFIIGNVKLGKDFKEDMKNIKVEHEAWLDFITESKIKAFPEIALMMIGGIGAMKPNGVIVGFYDPDEKPQETILDSSALQKFPKVREAPLLDAHEYVEILKDAIDFDRSLLIAKGFSNLNRDLIVPKNVVKKVVGQISKNKCIDMWITKDDWEDHSIVLTLQLGYMIDQVNFWKKYHVLRLFFVTDSELSIPTIREGITNIMDQYRISALIYVVKTDSSTHGEVISGRKFNSLNFENRCLIVNDLMTKFSNRRTSFIFTTLDPPPKEVDKYDGYLNNLKVLTKGLPPCLLIYGSKSVISLDI